MMFKQFSCLTIAILCICFLFNIEDMYQVCSIIFLFDVYLYFKCGLTYRPISFKNCTNPMYILLLSLTIVCLQNCITILIGNADVGNLMMMSARYEKVLYKVFYLGLIGVASFMLGTYLWTGRTSFPRRVPKSKNLIFWQIVLVLSFLLFLKNVDMMAMMAGSLYRDSGAAYRTVDEANYYETILNYVLIIVYALITKRNLDQPSGSKSLIKYVTRIPFAVIIISLAYIGLRMVSGDRGPVMYTLCLVFYSYVFSTGVHIKFKIVLPLVILAAFFIGILGIVRDGNLNDSFDERIVKAMQTEKKRDYQSILPLTQELANSSNCNFIAVADIEEDKTFYTLGKYTFYGIIAGVPGSSFILTNVFGVDLREVSPLEYVTISYFGKNYTMGLGCTPLAELYLDFGVFGTVLGMVWLGLLYGWIGANMYPVSRYIPIWALILVLKFSSTAVYIPRFTISGTIASALYAIILYYCVTFILDKIRRVFTFGVPRITKHIKI